MFPVNLLMFPNMRLAWAALEGVFKEHRGRTRSLLLLEILGRETAVEIDARLLQRVN